MKKNAGEQDKDCCLCTELNGGEFPSEYRERYAVQGRICIQTENFVAIPSLSPLLEGHLLLLPKAHLICLAGMGAKLAEEFQAFLSLVARKMKNKYGAAYYFEHGVVRPDDQACGINHAHLHILPMKPDRALAVDHLVTSVFSSNREISLGAALRQSRPEEAYLLHGNELDHLRIASSNRIPSQFMRRAVGKAYGVSIGDWRELDGVAAFLATRNQFMGQSSVVTDL